MPLDLKELTQELKWEYSVFNDQLKQLQKQITDLELGQSIENSKETPVKPMPSDGITSQVELQRLLGEQTYLKERVNILESKLKKINTARKH